MLRVGERAVEGAREWAGDVLSKVEACCSL